MPTGITEERFAALEAEVAQLKAQLNGKRYGVIGRSNPQRIEEMFGMFANDADAEEVRRTIEAEREKEREEARRPPDEAV